MSKVVIVVVGCSKQYKSFHLPTEDVKIQWINFIFDRDGPTNKINHVIHFSISKGDGEVSSDTLVLNCGH